MKITEHASTGCIISANGNHSQLLTRRGPGGCVLYLDPPIADAASASFCSGRRERYDNAMKQRKAFKQSVFCRTMHCTTTRDLKMHTHMNHDVPGNVPYHRGRVIGTARQFMGGASERRLKHIVVTL